MRWLPFSFYRKHLFIEIDFHEIVDELRDFDDRFFQIIRKHLAFLGVSCLLQLLVFGPLLLYTSGAWWYFLIMSLSWGVINFSIVMWIFDHILLRKFTDPDPFERFEAQRHVEKMLYLNIGLDLSYVFAGMFLYILGTTDLITIPALWKGFGAAVVLQGVFLFSLDNFFHRLHSRNIRKALPFFKQLMHSELQPGSRGADSTHLATL